MTDMTLPALITAAFWAFVLGWTVKLEQKKCGCSKEWRRDFIKYFAAAVIAFQFVILAKQNQLMMIAAPFMGLATLVFIGATISYIVDQRRKKCECSRGPERMVIFVFAVIQAVIIGSGLLGIGIMKGLKKN
jgi:hypothetical protein